MRHVESNFGPIRAEYFHAVLGQGRGTDPHSDSVSKPLEPDYDVSRKDGEHAEDALHRGSWDWHSYILNGVKNDVFKERCPKTAAVVDDVRPRKVRLRLAPKFLRGLVVANVQRQVTESPKIPLATGGSRSFGCGLEAS